MTFNFFIDYNKLHIIPHILTKNLRHLVLEISTKPFQLKKLDLYDYFMRISKIKLEGSIIYYRSPLKISLSGNYIIKYNMGLTITICYKEN